jgi:hypothetical protein
MSGPIIFITINQIEKGSLDKCKEAFRNSMDFLEANGPQLLAEVFINESRLRAHAIQIHQDSESILTHWKLADPYMRDVMQYLTTTHIDIYGNPGDAVMEGMRQLSSRDALITVKPKFVGFSRLTVED